MRTPSLRGFFVKYQIGFPRLYLYGFLFALVFATLELIQAEARRAVPTIAAGLIVLAIGVVLFARFVHKYPLPAIPREEENHGPNGA